MTWAGRWTASFGYNLFVRFPAFSTSTEVYNSNDNDEVLFVITKIICLLWYCFSYFNILFSLWGGGASVQVGRWVVDIPVEVFHIAWVRDVMRDVSHPFPGAPPAAHTLMQPFQRLPPPAHRLMEPFQLLPPPAHATLPMPPSSRLHADGTTRGSQPSCRCWITCWKCHWRATGCVENISWETLVVLTVLTDVESVSSDTLVLLKVLTGSSRLCWRY